MRNASGALVSHACHHVASAVLSQQIRRSPVPMPGRSGIGEDRHAGRIGVPPAPLARARSLHWQKSLERASDLKAEAQRAMASASAEVPQWKKSLVERRRSRRTSSSLPPAGQSGGCGPAVTKLGEAQRAERQVSRCLARVWVVRSASAPHMARAYFV